MTADTYIDEIVIYDKGKKHEIGRIEVYATCILIDSDDIGILDADMITINEKITLGNICSYLKNHIVCGQVWMENYLGTQLSEWGYDWEITYKE